MAKDLHNPSVMKAISEAKTKSLSVLLSFGIIMAFSNAYGAGCGALFAPIPQELVEAEARLTYELAHKVEILQSLEFDPSRMRPTRYLGSGWSGDVIEVRIDDRSFALKLLEDPKKRAKPESYDRAFDDGIIFQKILGELDRAPKVIGVIGQDAILSWIEKNKPVLKRLERHHGRPFNRAGLGLLMELTSKEGLKERFDRISVSANIQKKILADAELLTDIILALNINPKDIDVVIAPHGKLNLIDTAWYERGPPSFDILTRLKRLIAYSTEVKATSRKR
jgi:hypothetical protein